MLDINKSKILIVLGCLRKTRGNQHLRLSRCYSLLRMASRYRQIADMGHIRLASDMFRYSYNTEVQRR
jgi:hypothetical protein